MKKNSGLFKFLGYISCSVFIIIAVVYTDNVFCRNIITELPPNNAVKPLANQNISKNIHSYGKSNCGPLVLMYICRIFGIPAAKDELIKLSRTSRGNTSMLGLFEASKSKGIKTVALKTDFRGLKRLNKSGYKVISYLKKNYHYTVLNKIVRNKIYVFDPVMHKTEWEIPVNLFKKNWDGEILVMTYGNDKHGTLEKEIDKTVGLHSIYKILDTETMRYLYGGEGCQNSNAGGGNNGGSTSKDPVTLNNGNLMTTTRDITIPGKLPLEITRTYNAQIMSEVAGWTPRDGAGSWVVEDGIYRGQGDWSVYEQILTNMDVTLDMRTIEAGIEHSWDICMVNFRFRDVNNRYYFLIHTNGKIELAKFQNSIQYSDLAIKNTAYNPLEWNNIRITATNEIIDGETVTSIHIYINGVLELEYVDSDPILDGKVMLESYYCYGAFDNISISDNDSIIYTNDFNLFDDSDGIFGRNITFNYGIKVVEHGNRDITIITGEGRKLVFNYNLETPGTYDAPSGVFDTLTKEISAYYLRTKYGLLYTFDAEGKLTRISDPNGNENVVNYGLIDGIFKPITVTDSYGRQLLFSYNASGRVSRITDPIGREVNYEYNANGCLIGVTDPRGNDSIYTYYPNYNLESYTDPEGNIYQYTYYYNDRIYQQTDPSGNITTFEYLWNTTVITNNREESYSYVFFEGNDKLIAEIDFLGLTKGYTYDMQENLTSYTDRNGNTTTFSYDNMGNVTGTTNPLGNYFYNTFDPSFSNITTTTNARGNTYTFEYDPRGNLIRKILSALYNYETNMTYDGHGNILTIADILGHTTTYTYNDYGYLATITDPLGNITAFTYDIAGRLTVTEDANHNITIYEYDANNNLIRITDALGNETVNTYDNNNRQISTTQYYNGEPKATIFEYDWAGNTTQIIDPGDRRKTSVYDLTNYMFLGSALEISSSNSCGGCPGETTYFYYDINGRLIRTRDTLGNEVRYNYDIGRNLAQIVDANGNITSYTYNSENQLMQTTYPDRSSEYFDYDDNGNPMSKTDRKGQIITYEYDESDRQTRKTYPDGNNINYGYDALGRLITINDINGTITYVYDNNSRVTQIAYPDGKTIDYTYDAMGNLTRLTYPDGTNVNYVLDRLNRIRQIKDNNLNIIAEYNYDSLGRRFRKNLANNTYTIYFYDGSNNLLNQVNQTITGDVISSYEYTYNSNNHNRSSMTTLDGTYNYIYDLIYRLTEVTYPDGKHFSYAHDNLGNRLSQNNDGVITNNTYNNINQLTNSMYNEGRIGDRVTVRGRIIEDNVQNIVVNGITAEVSGNLFSAEDIPLAEGSNTITASVTDMVGNTVEDLINVTLQPITNIDYQYDRNGNMINKNADSDIEDYRYDYENRLTQIVKSGTGEYIWVENFSPKGPGWRDNTTDPGWDCTINDNGVITVIDDDPDYGHVYSPLQIIDLDQYPILKVKIDNVSAGANFSLQIQDYETPESETFGFNQTTSGIHTVNIASLMGWTGNHRFFVGIWVGGGEGKWIDLGLVSIGREGADNIITYTYDPVGRRTEKNINGEVIKYIYNGNQIIQETDSAGIVRASYIYGLGIDEPLTITREGDTYYYYFDGLGSVTDLIDESGNAIEKYKYDPFGKPVIIDPLIGIIRDSSIVSNPYMFTGREYDSEIDLYYYRARHYDYRTGRFLQADPIGYIDSLDLYVYSNNNPINLVDPSGTTVKVCSTKIIPPFPFKHKYVLVESRKSEFNGSWGFDYFPKNQETLEKVLAGEAVPGQIRKNEHQYQHPNKPKCKKVAIGTNYDYCIYNAAMRRRGLPPPLYQLNLYDCRMWMRDLLGECGIFIWDWWLPSKISNDTQSASYNSASEGTSSSDISK